MTEQEAKELVTVYQDVSHDLYNAVRLAKDMMIANNLHLPKKHLQLLTMQFLSIGAL